MPRSSSAIFLAVAAAIAACIVDISMAQKEVANDIRTSCSNPFGAGAYDSGDRFQHDGMWYECLNEHIQVIGCESPTSPSEPVPIGGTVVEDGVPKKCLIQKVGLEIQHCLTPQGPKKLNQEWNVNGVDKKCTLDGHMVALGCPSGKKRRRVAVGQHFNRKGASFLCTENGMEGDGCMWNYMPKKIGEDSYDDGKYQLRCTKDKGSIPVGCKTNKAGYIAFGDEYVEDGLRKRCTKARILLLGCDLMGIRTDFGRTFDKGDLRLNCTEEGFVAIKCISQQQQQQHQDAGNVYDFEDRFLEDVRMMKCTPQGIVVDETWKRTVIFVEYESKYGDNMFMRGGLSHVRNAVCNKSKPLAQNPCAIPIRHITKVNDSIATYKDWSKGDLYLDWYGQEEGQGIFYGIAPAGTPMMWSTNEVGHIAYQPLNTRGPAYWMVDLLMDCTRTQDGWFEHKAWLNNWEHDLKQEVSCDGTAGGQIPFNLGIDHPGRCGFINTYKFQSTKCTIDLFPQQ